MFGLALLVAYSIHLVLRKWKGQLIYTDDKQTKLLVSNTYEIDGKPDYIYKQYDMSFLPIELKNKKSNRPYIGDVMQLAAYFILIEEHYGKVKGGLLQYRNRSFYVRNSKRLRNKLINQLEQMKKMEKTETIRAFKKNERKCKNCVHRSICTQ